MTETNGLTRRECVARQHSRDYELPTSGRDRRSATGRGKLASACVAGSRARCPGSVACEWVPPRWIAR